MAVPRRERELDEGVDGAGAHRPHLERGHVAARRAAAMAARRTPEMPASPANRPRCTAETILRASGRSMPRASASGSGVKA